MSFSVGDVMIRVGLGFLARVIGLWASIPRGKFLFLSFKKPRRKSASLESLIGFLALRLAQDLRGES